MSNMSNRFLLIVTFLCGFSGYLQAQEPAPCEHDWGFPTWTCADDYSAATAHFTCALCGATEDVDGTLADWIELADGNKLYEVNHNGLHQQILGPNALNFGLNQTLPTNHPYYILTPDPRRGAYRIWSEDVKTVNYYILDDDDGSIDYSVNGQSMYLVTGYVNYRSDFDGNLNYFDNNNFVFGIVFTAKDRGDAVTVNVKGVAPHTYTVSNAIVCGTVTATSRGTNNAWLTKYSKAYEDDILWLDPTPDEGFELQSMTVTDAKGRDVEILEHDDRRYIIMPDVAVTINAQFRPTTWAALQTTLNNASTDANNPTVITLANDITATGSDAYLDLPYGHHVILDLNGHTIDRALTEAASNGYVLKVNESSTLTIRDSGTGGTITGGWIDYGTASCISFQGQTLRLEGGSISGNRSNHFGGAIAFKNEFYMTGGAITGNWSNLACDYGPNMCGQVFFTNKGDFYLSGGAITGNRCGNTTAGSAGIGLNNASSNSRTVHLSGTYTLSGNEQGNYNSATGEWTDLSASDILNSGYITYVIDDVITPAPSASPSAMILNTADGGTKASFTSGWATYMGDADPETCFVLSAADTMPGREIDILGGEVSVGLFYIDAQGEKTVHGGDHTAIASGAFTYLGTNNQTTWYYVNGNISSDDYIDLRGDVNLVLADGCRFNGKSFFIDQSLSIYAQSTGDDMGRFTTEGEYELDSGKSLNIHGGRVYLCCSGSATPLFEDFSGNLNITGGRVTLDCTENTLFRPYNKDNCVTIGWHVLGDYIQLQSCDNINPEVSITIRNGQAMTDGTTTYTGLLTSDQVCDLRDKTLQPCYLVCENSGITNAIAGVIAGNTVAFKRTFSAGKASTICLPFPMTNINGGNVYEFMDVTYDAQDGWVATMIDATPNRVTSTVAHKPYLFLPDADGEVTFSGTVTSVPALVVAGESTSGDWTFHGTYSRKDYGDEGFSGTVFGFAGTSGKATDGVTDVEAGQFVKAASGAYILPFRAYLTYSGSNTALHAPARGVTDTPAIPDRIKVRLLSSEGATTATGTIDMNTGEITIDQWYYLNGQPVNGAPSAPGLYLNSKGKKVMITE